MAGYNQPLYMAGNPQVQQAYQQLMQAVNPMQQQMMPQQPYALQGDNRIFVNGPTSALNIAMGANAVTPPILDSTQKVFYIIESDGAGTKTLQAFDYKPHEEKPVEHVEYATKDDIKALEERIEGLMPKQAARTRKASADAE